MVTQTYENPTVHVASTDVSMLVNLADEQMDLYERSIDPQERELRFHNAYAHLYRHIDRRRFVPEAEKARNRFLGLAALPVFPEDSRFCDLYLDYLA